ncbi:MAG TPA: glycoside hydrolase family 3 N-terminal domain-containing protein [Azospirillaceae bacterium]|nr:glycoside hydrolase family 3 N-terminal domain-containing protein [Azospirillaceae bacterium]
MAQQSSRHPLAVVFGAPGTVLTREQKDFYRDADPLGLILFKRNCEAPDQLRRLCAEFREAVGRADAPILIDFEGGEHQRMEPPVWPAFPAPANFGRLYRRDPERALASARLNGAAIGALLADHGVTVDCAPLLDVPVAGADPVIGERAFGDEPEQVAALAAAFMEGMLEQGVVPIVKHIPGHGRALVDSHKARPVVDTGLEALDATDFLPFKRLADAPWAMVAHVVYSAVDPIRPATVSPAVLGQVVRGRIGFGGVLVSDCIYMDSLEGTLAERCAAVLAAGMDVALSSHGDVAEWTAIAAGARPLTDAAAARIEAAARMAGRSGRFDVAGALAEIGASLTA